MEQPLFLNKYQPLYFNDFETDEEMIEILKELEVYCAADQDIKEFNKKDKKI